MTAAQPLLDRPDGAPLFHRPQGPVGAAAFLHDVHTLVATLPPGQHLLNLCRDRYACAVAFAAALVAGRTTLLNLPPEIVQARFPDATALVDRSEEPFPPGEGRGEGPAARPEFAGRLDQVLVRPAATGAATHIPLIPAHHLAAIVFTSGSTGLPVGHEKRWGELVARSRAAALQFGLVGGSILGMVPPQHMYGFETTVLLPLHAPVASWCGPAFFPADVVAACAACPAPRTLVTTPLQLRSLLQAGASLPLAACISATAPLDPALARQAEERWHAPMLEIFGATECGSIASRRAVAGPDVIPDWTPYPGIELLIEDAATTVLAPFARPTPLADLLEPVPGGFRLLGRRTDVVKLAGRRASLLGLNQALAAIPGVDDGAFVVPEGLDRTTARLVAVVVAPGRSAPAILAELRRVIDPAFLPRRVIRVDALPRNALGKLPRQALLDLVAATP